MLLYCVDQVRGDPANVPPTSSAHFQHGERGGDDGGGWGGGVCEENHQRQPSPQDSDQVLPNGLCTILSDVLLRNLQNFVGHLLKSIL